MTEVRRNAWTSLASLVLLLGALVQVACTREPEPLDLTSLRRSGESTFLCIGPDQKPAPLRDCALGDVRSDGTLSVGPPGYELHALVTQTLSAEVAVVRATNDEYSRSSTAKVLDVDPTNPGVTPLRVGGQPNDIVTTPGSSASFVTVAEPGKEGIFALPTSCIFAPTEEETRRDLTTWPACRLSSTPGAIRVLVDEGRTSSGSDFCGSGPSGTATYADDGDECRVDLSDETFSPGRRKLIVALPFESKLVVIDAQELLDRKQGTYDACHIEAEISLNGEFPSGLVQPLPADLRTDTSSSVSYPEIVGSYQPHPAGMDVHDGILVVADRGAPLVHLLDVRDPCAPIELRPLYVTSYASPDRVVTTSRVALSPMTDAGQQFVYAVDVVGEEMASLIPFDISPTSTSRLPMLRPGAPLLPYEPPDRIAFGSAVKDVSFAHLDRPISDPVLGQSLSRISCDPSPNISEDALGAQYRPSSGSIGAAPAVLRGTFAYALLSNGRLSVVDVEDYDAACRRPRTINTSSEPDFRGCLSDDSRFDYYTDDETDDGVPTVSDEASCRVVVPHRARSARFVQTVEGASIQAPSLRSYARLSRHGRGLTISRLTPEGLRNPILLGADFEGPQGAPPVEAQVYVGSTLATRSDTNDPLIIDPNRAERAAPVLPFYEPRAYPTSEVVTVTYEGDLDQPRVAGELFEPEGGISRFEDQAGAFCARGVQGQKLTGEMGRSRFNLSGGGVDRFVARHADYVQITNLLLNENDPYWDHEGASCGEGFNRRSGSGYELCDSVFRVGDGEDLANERDLAIVSAFHDHLMLTPRGESDTDAAQATLELLKCCFPTQLEYRIRAGHQWVVRGAGSGFQHPVVKDDTDEDLACVFDESPLSAYLRGRAFEVSNNNCTVLDPESPDACGVGPRTKEDVVCAYDASTGPVRVGSAADACIYSSLTRRFVVYRGLDATQRDATFAFEVIGGFEGMGISLSSNSVNVLPVSMEKIGQLPILGVVDSQNNGLSVVDLLSSQVAQNFY